MLSYWILNILFALLSVSSLFVSCEAFNDQNLSKWLFALFFAGLWGIMYAIKIMMNPTPGRDWANGYIIIIIVSCSLQSFYFLFQIIEAIIYSYIGQKQICGSFDTISGFAGCLCAGIPLFFSKIESKSYIGRITKILLVIVIIVIFISKSRSAIISASFVVAYWIASKYHISKRLKYVAIGGMVFLFVCCYFLKKDSADGRLFIWRCCWEMFKDKPLLGHGLNAFDAHYMDYQADFFSENPESKFVLLADNVKHVYNEFISLSIHFGIIGLIILFALILLLSHCYKRNPSLKTRTSMLSLISIGVFALFSYPFEYVFIWIVTLLDIAIIIHEAYPHITLKNILVRAFISITILCTSFFVTYKVYLRTCSELEWNKIAIIARQGQMSKVSQRYQELLLPFRENAKFLYNYAVELYMMGQYESSMNIAQKCRKLYADYDLELLLALNAIKMNCSKEAEVYLQSASLMCPNRFVPLFELTKLYERENKINKAKQIATSILKKKIKIHSQTVHSIRVEMKCLLEKYKNDS